MKRIVALSALGLIAAFPVSAFADSSGRGSSRSAQTVSCWEVQALYQQRSGIKAYAENGLRGPAMTCGAAWGYRTERVAMNKALGFCRQNGSGCRVVAVER